MEPTVLIIGGGTFGTSTAYHLAQKYKDRSRVTVVDRAPSPPKPAAAIDINRVIRTDYPSSLYCDLAYEAIHAWFWSLELGHHFHKVGWLMLNEEGSDIADRINATFRNRGSNCAEEGLLQKLEHRWDGVLKGTDVNGFNDCYFNPEAGWVNAAGATASFMDAAMKRGINRVTAEVLELLLDERGDRIKGARLANGQILAADKVVLAAGAWTSALLSPIEDALNMPEHDRIERQVKATGTVSAYYHVSDEEIEQLIKANTPVIVYGGNGEVIPPSRQNKLMKYSNSWTTFFNTITTKSGHKISVPREDQYTVPESLMRETEAIMSSKVAPYFTKGKKPEYWRVCYDAQTPTEDWLMCQHPHLKLSNLYLAVGGSFHSYKFMPNAGNYMLNVLDGISNGDEKDKAWAWKTDADWTDVREFGLMSGKAVAKRELKDLEGGHVKL